MSPSRCRLATCPAWLQRKLHTMKSECNKRICFVSEHFKPLHHSIEFDTLRLCMQMRTWKRNFFTIHSTLSARRCCCSCSDKLYGRWWRVNEKQIPAEQKKNYKSHQHMATFEHMEAMKCVHSHRIVNMVRRHSYPRPVSWRRMDPEQNWDMKFKLQREQTKKRRGLWRLHRAFTSSDKPI